VSVALRYVRKNANIEAARVNLAELSKIRDWCDGSILASDASENAGRSLFIEIKLPRQLRAKKRSRAYVGDWIVKDDEGFKVYSDDEFRVFSPAIKDEDRYTAILNLVKVAMLEQDSIAHRGEGDMVLVAKGVAQRIYDLG
jgi:hypothetical protein